MWYNGVMGGLRTVSYWTERQREEFARLVREGRTVRCIRQQLDLTESDMVLIPLVLNILQGGKSDG